MLALGVKSDETYVCAPAPFQHAVATGLQLGDSFFHNIKAPFHRKKITLAAALEAAAFCPQLPEGAYYLLVTYPDHCFQHDVQAAEALVREVGVGSVPGSAFFPAEQPSGLPRFCFGVTDETLREACERLAGVRITAGEIRSTVVADR